MNLLVLEKKANDFRKTNGFDGNSSIYLRGLLEKLNVLTVFKPLKTSLAGMALKITDGAEERRFMLINSNNTIGNQHFTICHELYHLFVQENFNAMTCVTGQFDKKDSEEYNADSFAAFLLLPEHGVKALIPDEELKKDKITLQTLLKIEHSFSCSRAALLHTLKGLGIISKEYSSQYYTDVIRGAVEYGYSVELYKPGNHDQVIGDYGILARQLYDKEKISESHYLDLLLDLGMNVEELENWGNGEQ